MINIIIPAYNAHTTIDRCISSIVMQSFKDYDITIVNDGGKSYLDIIARYKDMIKIREISNSNKVNRGAGYARQFGLNHTSGEFVMFMDADDVLYTPYALQSLYDGLVLRPTFAVCAGRFIEESAENSDVILHQEDMVWVFGKLYKREFLNKYNIRFCPGSRWNEDNGFNCCVRLCSNDNAQINFISEIVYCWTNQPNSITKDDSYAYGKSFVGNIENMLWAITLAKNTGVPTENVNNFALETFFSQYQYMMEVYERDTRFLRQNWEWMQVFYDIAIRPIKDSLTKETISMYYAYTMSRAYENGYMDGIVPVIGIYDFINLLDSKQEFEYDEDDQSHYFPSDSAWLVVK